MQIDIGVCCLAVIIAVLVMIIVGHKCTEGISIIRKSLEGLVAMPNCNACRTEGYSDNIVSADIRSSMYGIDNSIGNVSGVMKRTFHSKDPSETIYGAGPDTGGLPSTHYSTDGSY